MGASTLLNGTLGLAMLLAIPFCMPADIESVLGSDTYYPFMNIYAYAVGSTKGATSMVSMDCCWGDLPFVPLCFLAREVFASR